jgi:hypothetical protein
MLLRRSTVDPMLLTAETNLFFYECIQNYSITNGVEL